MTRKVRIASICAGVVLLIGLVLPRVVNVNNFRPELETKLSETLGRQVKIGELSLSIFSGSVSANDIVIADDAAFGKDPFITAKSFSAGVSLGPLIFSRALQVTGITLEEPQITLLRGRNGIWNVSSIGKAAAAPENQENEAEKPAKASSLSIARVTVANGRLVVANGASGDKPSIYEKVHIEVKELSSSAPFLFTMNAALPGGGSLDLKGKGGPITIGDAITTPLEATIEVRKLDLAASGLMAPSTGVAGIVDLEGGISLSNGQAKAVGTVKTANLKLAAKGVPMKRPVEMKYDLGYNLKTDAGTIAQADVAIGKAVSKLTGGYQLPAGQLAALNMKLTGNSMPVDDLEAALPALGVVLPSGSKLQGGSVSVDLSIAGPSDQLVVSGPIRLANAKLAGFDLGSKLSAIPAFGRRQTGGQDTSIQNLSATVRVSPDGVQANAINLEIPALGVVTGNGTVSSSGALNFGMNATLSGGSGVVQKSGLGGQAGGGIPFSIQGTASDPKFVADVKSMAGNAITRKAASAVPEKPLAGKLGTRRR